MKWLTPVLQAAFLGLLGWILITVIQTKEDVAVIKAQNETQVSNMKDMKSTAEGIKSTAEDLSNRVTRLESYNPPQYVIKQGAYIR